MKKTLVFICCFIGALSSPGVAQQKTLDIPAIHQLVRQSMSEHKLQREARNSQALATANEQANLSLLAKLKNKYRQLQQRYNTLGAMINFADIGIQATPVVRRIIGNQGQIVLLAAGNPAILALAYQTEIAFAEKSRRLLGYIIGLSLSIGDVNQMKASDRKMLFDYVLFELNNIQELSANLAGILQYSNLSSLTGAISPFRDYVNQDRFIAEYIIRNAKYLK
jgi:hypothetical protein